MVLSTLKSSQASRSHRGPLPLIPEKRYFTISEAAFLCGVKAHVLRYWEQEFLQLRPSKRRGNRRYYQYKDVLMVRQIRGLLYEQGFTIEGARAQLANGLRHLVAASEVRAAKVDLLPSSLEVETVILVKKMIIDLERVLKNLKSTEEVL